MDLAGTHQNVTIYKHDVKLISLKNLFAVDLIEHTKVYNQENKFQKHELKHCEIRKQQHIKLLALKICSPFGQFGSVQVNASWPYMETAGEKNLCLY